MNCFQDNSIKKCYEWWNGLVDLKLWSINVVVAGNGCCILYVPVAYALHTHGTIILINNCKSEQLYNTNYNKTRHSLLQ